MQRELCSDCTYTNAFAIRDLEAERQGDKTIEAAEYREWAEAKIMELKGICETAIDIIEKGRLPRRTYGWLPPSVVRAVLNQLTRAR